MSVNGNIDRPCSICARLRPVVIVMSERIKGKLVSWLLCVRCWCNTVGEG